MKYDSQLFLSLFLALLFFIAPTASAQDASEYEDQVIVQLEALAVEAEKKGFEVTHDFVIDDLNGNADESFTLTLEEGVTYLIASVCDQDCSDVDIEIYDENDNLIEVDEESDDVPVVTVSPAWTGEFTINVHMYECSTDPCFYGIGVFGQ